MKKKLIKILISLILVTVIWVLYEMTTISTKTINRELISFKINNIRNPQVKKLMRILDNYYASLLLIISDEAKSHFINDDIRSSLPNEILIKKTENFSENLYPLENNGSHWHRNYASHSSNRFSKLSQINKNNLNKLSVAWEYTIEGDNPYDIQSNAIVAENKIIIPASNKEIICLNAKSGELLWKFKLKDGPPRRGMVYLKGSSGKNSKIFFSSYKKLIALNIDDGSLDEKFGKKGMVNLLRPSLTSPAIFKNNLIVTTSEPSLNVYDINTGKFLWKFILIKEQLQTRNGGKRYDYSGGNPWGGFSLDEKRGIVYLTTGNAGKYFNGVNRPGKNNYANSIVAIDILKKKRIWDFQEVRHDIWNLDIPAPPILGSITKGGNKIDVVIGLTKLGNTIVLDRTTGKPIFDFHLKKAPKSSLPGEKTNFYQPSLKFPEPFAKQVFDLNQITNLSPESEKYILEKIKNHNYGFFEPYQIGKKNIQFNFHGGAEWSGGSYDLKSEMLYVTSSNIAWEAEIVLNTKKNKFSPEP